MNIGAILAAVFVPIALGFAATFIVSKVQTVIAQHRRENDVDTHNDSDL